MKLKGSEIIMESLLREGVDVMFGYPGGAILPTYDAMSQYEDQLHHVLVRHEQGASHMADGYARATGKVGVYRASDGDDGFVADRRDNGPSADTGNRLGRLSRDRCHGCDPANHQT